MEFQQLTLKTEQLELTMSKASWKKMRGERKAALGDVQDCQRKVRALVRQNHDTSVNTADQQKKKRVLEFSLLIKLTATDELNSCAGLIDCWFALEDFGSAVLLREILTTAGSPNHNLKLAYLNAFLDSDISNRCELEPLKCRNDHGE